MSVVAAATRGGETALTWVKPSTSEPWPLSPDAWRRENNVVARRRKRETVVVVRGMNSAIPLGVVFDGNGDAMRRVFIGNERWWKPRSVRFDVDRDHSGRRCLVVTDCRSRSLWAKTHCGKQV